MPPFCKELRRAGVQCEKWERGKVEGSKGGAQIWKDLVGGQVVGKFILLGK